ncbi:MAG: hypothetical protein ABR583_14660 [Gaiellaceae bacterium]
MLALVAFLALATTAAANHIPYQKGNVFAGIGNGKINEFSPSGTLIEQLDTTSSSIYETGMCFDNAGNLYSTNFSANNMTKFDSKGAVLIDPFGSGFNLSPESCVVDAAGNIYVGQAGGSADVLKLSSSGALLDSFNVATENRGSDFIDLAADQCTLFYTSEGSTIKRYNVCTKTQLADFAGGLNAPCFGLRIRPNGEVLVACASQVYRLNAAGAVIQNYPISGSSRLFALSLDPDNTTFWTGDINNGQIWRVNISTGAIVTTFASQAQTQLAGLAVFGEITIAKDTTPPSCQLTASGTDTNGKKFIEVTVQDTGSGLKSITVTKQTNATVTGNSFTPGTKNPVVIRATRNNNSLSAQLALRAEDQNGNVTNCDPVITTVRRSVSKRGVQTYRGLPAVEHKVMITNGRPGLRRLDVTVNGRQFKVRGLKAGETRRISVASAMKRGSRNVIQLRGYGGRGANATVVIHD